MNIAALEEVKRGNEARPVRLPSSVSGTTTQGEGPRGEGPTRLIVVLDLSHTTWEDQIAGREALIKAIAATADSGVPVGLAVLNRTGLHEVHVFFDDPKLLIACLKRSLGQADDVASANLMTNTGNPDPFHVEDVSDMEAARSPQRSLGTQRRMVQPASRAQTLTPSHMLRIS